MRLRPTFEVRSVQALRDHLEVWTRLQLALMRRAKRAGKPFPNLYQSGVRYRREKGGTEEWKTVPQILHDMEGDCEDLATWRAAELRFRGLQSARVEVKRGGLALWHIVVSYERQGRRVVEDPSQRLGMKGVA